MRNGVALVILGNYAFTLIFLFPIIRRWVSIAATPCNLFGAVVAMTTFVYLCAQRFWDYVMHCDIMH